MSRLECRRLYTRVKLANDALHPFSCTHNDPGPSRVLFHRRRFRKPPNSHCSFGLTIRAEERRIAEYPIIYTFHLLIQLKGSLKVVLHEFREDVEPLVKLKQANSGPI